MEYSCVQFHDLPDEILLIILKKLSNPMVLYSLMGVNKRLDDIVHDYVFTNSLTLLEHLPTDHISPLPDPVLDQLCSQILPDIQHKINWLDLESSSMERILLSGHYSNLSGLGIFNIEKQNALQFLSNENSLVNVFKNQIFSLVIQTIYSKGPSTFDYNELIFKNILRMFPNLKYLNFHPSDICLQQISFDKLLPYDFPSTLLELHIKVRSIKDCLHLLDDCFDQLRVFNVHILSPVSSITEKYEKKLLHLKSFSLTSVYKINFYDEVLLPLLYRMSNLEDLGLYFPCFRRKSFIDGSELKMNVINYLPRLKTFAFNICSIISSYNPNDLLRNEDIQYTFREFRNKEIISSVDYFPDENESQCHVYIYPFTMTTYQRITNHFPGGLFECVRTVSLFDERPFEHQFFIQIQKSFPLMKKLTIINRKAQQKKQSRKCKDVNQDLPIIEYPHLTYLDLNEVHYHYIEQFLLDTKTSLGNNVTLFVRHERLQKVTHNFKRKATRINCSKIIYECVDDVSSLSKHLENYFLRIRT